MKRTANRFGTGGCYECRSCGRKTRSTGRGDNENMELCVECCEYHAAQNAIWDDGESVERLEALQYWKTQVVAKGGVLR